MYVSIDQWATPDAATSLAPVDPADRGSGPLPLSFYERRIWYLDRLVQGVPIFNLTYMVRMTGALDDAALCGAIRRIVARHELLRTSYPMVDERPERRIAASDPEVCEVHDLRHLPYEEAVSSARRLASRLVSRRFDLGTGPLIRFPIVKVSSTEWYLLIVAHLIIADVYSFEEILRELVLFSAPPSRADADKVAPEGDEQRVQYADFALWQRRLDDAGAFDEGLRFWRAYLEEAGGPRIRPPFPLDSPRPREPTFRGGRCFVSLPPRLARRSIALAREGGTTLQLVLVAGLNVLLARYADLQDGAGSQDVVIGYVVDGRLRPEVERVLGFFGNVVPLHSRIDPGASFNEVLQQLRRDMRRVRRHSHVPVSKIVADLHARGVLGADPFLSLFQVLVRYDELPERRLGVGGVEIGGRSVAAEMLPYKGYALHDLNVRFQQSGEAIDIEIEFAADVLDELTVRQFAKQYRLLIERLVEEPAAPIGPGSHRADGAVDVGPSVEPPPRSVSPSLAAALAACGAEPPPLAQVEERLRGGRGP